MRNLYLIGMMGAGKTATGKALAGLIGKSFVDLDSEIEIQTHLTINEIFAKRGEPFFRAEEKRILKDVSRSADQVVATGGGLVLDPENVALIRTTGRVVYLTASFETLWGRVQHKRDRPLLSVADPKTTLLALFDKRRPLYEIACHGKIETDGLSPEAAAKKVVEQILEK